MIHASGGAGWKGRSLACSALPHLPLIGQETGASSTMGEAISGYIQLSAQVGQEASAAPGSSSKEKLRADG